MPLFLKEIEIIYRFLFWCVGKDVQWVIICILVSLKNDKLVFSCDDLL